MATAIAPPAQTTQGFDPKTLTGDTKTQKPPVAQTPTKTTQGAGA